MESRREHAKDGVHLRPHSEPVQGMEKGEDEEVRRHSEPPPDRRSKSLRPVPCRLGEARQSIEDLKQKLENAGDEKLHELFVRWCVEQADVKYPNIGSVPYAVTYFPIGEHTDKPSSISQRLLEGAQGFEDFRESAVQESQLRGDKAQRYVGRAFRILNWELERRNESTMFIVSQLCYDNMLAVLRRPKDLNVQDRCKKMLDSKCSYINIPEEEFAKRGEFDLMVLHQEKGAIFVQIKSLLSATGQKKASAEGDGAKANCKGRNECDPKAKIRERIEKAEVQLEKDVNVFCSVMAEPTSSGAGTKASGSCPCQVTRVVALPNLSNQDLDDASVERKQGIVYLLKEDLFQEDMNVSESETCVDNFLQWWIRLPTPGTAMKLDLMKEIVAKYIGPLSIVMKDKDGTERERLRHFRDCVSLTGTLLERWLLNSEQEEILSAESKRRQRVYLSGPPGSGKTVLLVLKGRVFLAESQKHNVIILNMYRGAAGRAIGRVVFEEVTHSLAEPSKERVHHVKVNVSENVRKFVGCIEALRKSKGFTMSDALFIVDEICVEDYCQEVLATFHAEFSDSSVWCAGLFSHRPKGFTEHPLNRVYRCPSSVQNLLFQVDWDVKRKEHYRRDAEDAKGPTNGPIPLCIRHMVHKQGTMVQCRQCAKELAQVLKKEKLVEEVTRGERAAGPSTGDDKEPDTDPRDRMRVAILVSLPRCLYQKDRTFLETSQKQYDEYMQRIAVCPFIQTLTEEGIPVTVKTELACMDLCTDAQDKCFATWVYNFEGLESDIVVFLPGDMPGTRGSTGEELVREIPAPGLRKTDTAGDPSPESSGEGISCDDAKGNLGSGEDAKGNLGSGEDAKGNLGSGGDAKGNLGSGEDAKGNLGSGEDTKGNIGSGEDAKGNLGSGEDATSNLGSGEDAKGNLGSGEDAKGNLGSGEDAKGNIGSGDDAKGSLGSGEDAKGNLGSGEDAKGNIGSGDDAKGSLGSGEDAKGNLETSNKDKNSTVSASIASLHWRSDDIARYSSWDQTNIMVAASRCLSLLILIVP